MWNCIKIEHKNLIKREEKLRNAVHGIQEVEVAVPMTQKIEQEKEGKVYI